MAEKKVKLMKVEFIVEGGEDYYACLEFKRVRASVVDIVKNIVEEYLAKIDSALNLTGEPCVKYVKLNFSVTGQKPLKKKWLKSSLESVFGAEYLMVEAQKKMLDGTSKL